MTKSLTASADWWSQFDYPRVETGTLRRVADAIHESDDVDDYEVHRTLIQAKEDIDYLGMIADKNAELIVSLLKDIDAILVMEAATDITEWCDKHDLASYTVYKLETGCAVTFTEQVERDFFKLYLKHQ